MVKFWIRTLIDLRLSKKLLIFASKDFYLLIAMSIILIKLILKFVNQRIKTKIISSQMKQLLIRLVKIRARFLCKLKADNGMVAHKSTIRLIINFHKEQRRCRKQYVFSYKILIRFKINLNKVIILVKKETTSTSVVTFKFLQRFLNSMK